MSSYNLSELLSTLISEKRGQFKISKGNGESSKVGKGGLVKKVGKGNYMKQGKKLTTGYTGEIKTKEVRRQEPDFRRKNQWWSDVSWQAYRLITF